MAAATDSQLVAAKKMTGAAASTRHGPADCPDGKGPGSTSDSSEKREKLTASTICILPSHADTLPSCSPTLASLWWLSYHRPECLGEFQKIAEIEAIGPQRRPRRRKIPYGAETWPTSIV